MKLNRNHYLIDDNRVRIVGEQCPGENQADPPRGWNVCDQDKTSHGRIQEEVDQPPARTVDHPHYEIKLSGLV